MADTTTLPTQHYLRCHPAARDALKLLTAVTGGQPSNLNPLFTGPHTIDETMPAGAWEIHDGTRTISAGNIFGTNPPTSPGRVAGLNDGNIFWVPDTEETS
jgi:hypothetical protein